MYIPLLGKIITALTFPGVVVHEFAHRFFCDVTKVPVYNACYLTLVNRNNCGYIIHEQEKTICSAFLISIGPLIINSTLCAVLSLPGILHLSILHDCPCLSSVVLMWIGFSIGLHALPSDVDMTNLLHSLTRLGANTLTIVIIKLLSYVFSFFRFIRDCFIGLVFSIGA